MDFVHKRWSENQNNNITCTPWPRKLHVTTSLINRILGLLECRICLLTTHRISMLAMAYLSTRFPVCGRILPPVSVYFIHVFSAFHREPSSCCIRTIRRPRTTAVSKGNEGRDTQQCVSLDPQSRFVFTPHRDKSPERHCGSQMLVAYTGSMD